jgi:hypothetical protein
VISRARMMSFPSSLATCTSGASRQHACSRLTIARRAPPQRIRCPQEPRLDAANVLPAQLSLLSLAWHRACLRYFALRENEPAVTGRVRNPRAAGELAGLAAAGRSAIPERTEPREVPHRYGNRR